MEEMKYKISSEWEITDLGKPMKIIGIEVTHLERSLTISQERYIDSILKRQGMLYANPVATPLDSNIKLEPILENQETNRSNSYASLLGELQFLANTTCPDIAHAVNQLASYTANPSLQHVAALKRVLRYLTGTKSYGLTFTSSCIVNDDTNLFWGYADTAYSTEEYKSTTGYMFIVAGGAITWMSKKQSTIAMSSTEAKYVALSEAAREACWLRSLFSELGFPQTRPTIIRGDNNRAIAMAKNPQFHKRAKHIAIKWHWICDLVKQGEIEIELIRDPEQTADILTKALTRPKHKKHVKEMGLRST